MLKLLRTVRLDASDAQVYERVCKPGEWAVPGSFVFMHDSPETLSGKRLQAFQSGFLGTETFGWSTLVEVARIDEDEYQQVIDRLAAHFIEHYGAPHIAAALPAAGEEVQYAADACEHEPSTLIALERGFSDDGVVERLKVVRPNAASHDQIKFWSVD